MLFMSFGFLVKNTGFEITQVSSFVPHLLQCVYFSFTIQLDLFLIACVPFWTPPPDIVADVNSLLFGE